MRMVARIHWLGWLPLLLSALVGLPALLACGCTDDASGRVAQRRAGPMRVVVTIPPLMWAVKDMAPSDAEVTLILSPGQSEHGFEITPSQFRAITDADLVVMVGHGLETKVSSTLALAKRPWRRVVNFEQLDGIELIDGAACTPGCTDGHHHHPYAADPHLWLDPAAMAQFVDRVAAAMRELIREGACVPDPEVQRSAAEQVDSVLAGLRAECESVDRAYRERLEKLESRRIVTHHNAYSYLARRYGLEVAAVLRPIEVMEPTPGDLQHVVSVIREGGVHAIFVEPQFGAAAAQRVAQTTGVSVLTIDPLGDGDWAGTMRSNLDALARGLGGG